MLDKNYYVYILANRRNGTIYVGVTSRLKQRVWEHKEGVSQGFTKKYKIHLLVYYETYNDVRMAIAREKQLKNWKRLWKIELIEKENYCWRDLYYELTNF